MKQILSWFVLSCKRYLKKPSFVLTLILLPIGCFWIHNKEQTETQSVNIAICVSENQNKSMHGEKQGLSYQLVEYLLGESRANETASPLFHFYACQSEEEVKAEVASKRSECGYVIAGDLQERLDAGEGRRSITVYRAPSTMLDRLSDEVVFAALARLYDREIFVNYIANEAGMDSSLAGEAEEFYDIWADSGTTFHFEYCYLDQADEEVLMNVTAISVFPVRGLVAVALFLIGVYSAMLLEIDEKKGLFLRLLYHEKICCKAASCAAPVTIAAISALTALWAGGCMEGWIKELVGMFIYVLVVTGYGLLLKSVIPKPQIIGCMMPFLLVTALLFCPVFLDVGAYVPQLAAIGRLLPPWYYLRAF